MITRQKRRKGKLYYLINRPNVLKITWHSSRHSTPEGTDSCHGNLLRGVLLGAGVSGCHHVRFEQSALQIHVVVR